METIQHNPDIWTIHGFLTTDRCRDIIILSEQAGYEEATVSLTSGATMMKNVRNNERLVFDDQALADELWAKLSPFVPSQMGNAIATGLNPRFRCYKYLPGQRFKRHIDGRVRISPTEESRFTCLIYLNEDFEGGETKFDDITIHPRTGSALCFLHELKHEGCAVTAGTKYALRTDVMFRIP